MPSSQLKATFPFPQPRHHTAQYQQIFFCSRFTFHYPLHPTHQIFCSRFTFLSPSPYFPNKLQACTLDLSRGRRWARSSAWAARRRHRRCITISLSLGVFPNKRQLVLSWPHFLAFLFLISGHQISSPDAVETCVSTQRSFGVCRGRTEGRRSTLVD